jgi:hypothetical protein
MDHEPAVSAERPKRSLMPMLLLPLVAFVVGLAAMGWLLAHWTGGATMLGVAPEPAPAAEAPPTVAVEAEPQQAGPASSPQEPQRLLIDPEITRRVNLLEEKLNTLDLQSRAAVGNADRAEGLLVAFAARRALDNGVPLGYIEGLLGQRFGGGQRQAVATILTSARAPVTLQELQEGLQDVGPQLIGGSPNQSWWTAFRTELGGLVTIRKKGTASPLPAERLRRATRRLEAGQVPVALAEVLRLPGRDKGADWIAKARRYVAARNALDQIEAAALLVPSAPLPTAPAARQPAPARPTARPSAKAAPRAAKAR